MNADPGIKSRFKTGLTVKIGEDWFVIEFITATRMTLRLVELRAATEPTTETAQ